MKRLLLLCIIFLHSIQFLRSQSNVFIPDENFKNYLNLFYPDVFDTSGDSVNIEKAATITGTLDCSNREIRDISGIEYFINIDRLLCNINYLNHLPELSSISGLRGLDCSINNITSLPDLSTNNNITILNCSHNKLTELPDLTNNNVITEFLCDFNKLDFSDAKELRIIDAKPSLTGYFIYTRQNSFGKGLKYFVELDSNLTLNIADQDSATSFQWFFNGNPINGANDTILSITNFTLDKQGIYYCKSYGNALSFPPMVHEPGIIEFESEPFLVYVRKNVNVYIPDDNFRNFLNTYYPSVLDDTQDSLIADSALAIIGNLDCSSMNIENLTGIEYFLSLRELNCYNNQLTEFPDISNLRALEVLNCSNNIITTIGDFTQNTVLKVLDISGNQLINLPNLTKNMNLSHLRCSNNLLKNINGLSGNINLTYLQCTGNELDSLPNLDSNVLLQTLQCGNNYLVSLPDLSRNSNLKELSCSFNNLTNLPSLSSNFNLVYLACYYNNIKELPELSNCTNLLNLDCSYNSLSRFPDLSTNTSLDFVNCYSNKLDFSDAREIRIADAMPHYYSFIFIYHDQKPFGNSDSIFLTVGNELIINISSQDSALSYQWFHNDIMIDGAIDTLLVISSVTSEDSGKYTCKSYGTALLVPPLNSGPGISEFISEPFNVYVDENPLIIVKNNKIKQVKIFPNPTTHFIQIQDENFNAYELYDISGRFLAKSQESIIDFGKWEEGLFFVKIFDNIGNSVTRKVIYKKK